MKSCNIEFDFYEQVKVTKMAINKQLSQITEDKINRNIIVNIHYLDSENNLISGERIVIEGKNYDLIMSVNPDFAPGKRENEYREDDLWYVIDKIKSEQTA